MNQRQKGLQDELELRRRLYRQDTDEPDEWPDVLDYVRETTKDLEPKE